MINTAFQKLLPLVIEILRKHKVKDAYLFGSATTDKFNESSDVDLLINFEEGLAPLEKGELMLDLQIALQDKLKRDIDLLTESSLKNPYFIEEVKEKRIKIYE